MCFDEILSMPKVAVCYKIFSKKAERRPYQTGIALLHFMMIMPHLIRQEIINKNSRIIVVYKLIK